MIAWKLMDSDISILRERVKEELEAADEFTTRNDDSLQISEANTSDVTMESNENDLELYTVRLWKTESSLLDDFFLVKGRKLLNLFRFCPICGMKLSQACLSADGNAPIVDFVCTACNPSVNRWNGQDCATDVP
ncbi:unnamed protein product [Angiostrongylus costaricensis]|uniref:ZZ-type domain-containing protein n=1 Tax=Angiostrongylus costaricensis TaxID=334426 RepID=A0A0R3Q041_ANGCS|nr:unnamed protein product [Angiostrongylus costaricensis]